MWWANIFIDLFMPHKKVKAWPGKQFIIQLTGMDQFKRQTTFAARFRLTNHSSVSLISSAYKYVAIDYY
jgi:hypothetical protein